MKASSYQDSTLLPLVSSPSTDDGTQKTLACLRSISRLQWLATFYRGGQLLQLRREPCLGERGASRFQWLLKEEYKYDDCVAMPRFDEQGFVLESPYYWGQPKRGKVHGFSQQARLRLLCKVNELSRPELPKHAKFVTLTYPRELLPSWQWAKRQLDNFLHALFKRWGKHGCLWRMEYQEDGSIHFHLLVFMSRFLPWRWVAKQWDVQIGNQCEPEESASTQVQGMRNTRQAFYYVSKYIAKDTEDAFWDLEHGRHWGARHWALMPVHVVLLPLTEAAAYAWRRTIKRIREAKGVKTRDLGAPLPFCTAAAAGITIFLSERECWRLVRWTQGYGKGCLRRRVVRLLDNTS